MPSPDRDWERWLERKGVLGEPWAGLADRGVPFTWQREVNNYIMDVVVQDTTAQYKVLSIDTFNTTLPTHQKHPKILIKS